MKKIRVNIIWQNENVVFEERIFLFCFGQKCMSGKITLIKDSGATNEFEVWIDFIDPTFFKDEFIVGNYFTINESSRVLAKCQIKEIL